MDLKETVKTIPIVRDCARVAYRLWTRSNRVFPGSAEYWERRYAAGGNSGAGSYRRLAEYKAEVLNDFVKTNAVKSVIEFGVGDGNQLGLMQYPKYIGLDVSKSAIRRCREKFAGETSKSFFLYDSSCFVDPLRVFRAELAISLDVIYHLVEDEIFESYMRHLFAASERYVIVYASDRSTVQSFHERDRAFSTWIDQNVPQFERIATIKNRYPYDPRDKENTSKADFFIYQRRS